MASSFQFKSSLLYLNPFSLRYYDFFAGLLNRIAWRCPQERLRADYHHYVGPNHLEVGAKTGKMLDQLNRDTRSLRLSLIDLNLWSLKAAKKRLARYTPNVYQLNIFADDTPIAERFDSIALNRVLQNIPQGFYAKGILFYHLQKLLKPHGVLFGSTVVAKGCQHNLLSLAFLKIFNMIGLLQNREDSVLELEKALKAYFRDVKIDVVGSTVLFSAQHSRMSS